MDKQTIDWSKQHCGIHQGYIEDLGAKMGGILTHKKHGRQVAR